MFLILAVVLFGLYVANVVLGALAGNAFMGDVAEMISLFAASIAFTIAILKRETAERRRKSEEENILKGGIE
jgi:hypothetical protein